MKDFSYLTNSHPSFIEELYKQYVANPKSIDQEFRKFFDGFDFAINQHNGVDKSLSEEQLQKEFAVYQLIQGYKKKGHLLSDTNPVRPRKNRAPELQLSDYNLSEKDFKTTFYASKYVGMDNPESLEKILEKLQKVFCGKFGIEYTYVREREQLNWIENAVFNEMHTPLTLSEKRRIVEKLTEADVFEAFLHKKYVGQKRFSLEGGENTITLLDQIIEAAAQHNASEVVLGMTHRGRLNVLSNILGKTYEQLFSEFEGMMPTESTMGTGDVKYHMGFSSYVKTSSKKSIYLKLTPNPSHLETVGSVVMGYARNKVNTLYDKEPKKVVPVVVHGDASIAGQGIIYELMQMSRLKGYGVGGTIHVVINNQVGFTTNFDDARSSDYCTSIAATMQCPVFHVNGDDAEAIARVAKIAVAYRQFFKRDIFIDILCYRKHGHNESDDPKYTQPSLYKLIEKHKTPRQIYMENLASSESEEETVLAMEMETSFWNVLQKRLDGSKENPLRYSLQQYEKRWSGFRKATEKDFEKSPKTAITETTLNKLTKQLLDIPRDFAVPPKMHRQFQDKLTTYKDKKLIDWATGELLAFASLLQEGKRVRLSGQDVYRGTFSHRHAMLMDDDGKEYHRFEKIKKPKGAEIRFVNSLLSEYAVLGFEYGYAMSSPNSLVIWEAQFGDFVNGAQIIIDQYLTSAEEKWGIASGMVLFLPHGFEGQGPEHSSARIERFLQSCSDLNLVITNITTSANLFHALRRQQIWNFRKPLINFSPKANLRSSASFSNVSEFTNASFKEILDDVSKLNSKNVQKVIFCSGKIYFELDTYRNKEKIKNIAIVRIEQLYPFPKKQYEQIRKKYASAKIWLWVQEEPKNMGACSYLLPLVGNELTYISRPSSASPATGFYKKHSGEQENIIQKAFSI